MLITILAYLLLIAGTAFCYGAYRAFAEAQLSNASQAVIPIMFLIGGLGFLGRRSWSRYWVLALAFFFIFLGALIFRKTASAVDFLPLVPLIDVIPTQVLGWNLTAVSIACFFVLPALAVWLVNLKEVAFRFEQELDRRVAWHGPHFVVFVSAFVIVYALLAEGFLGQLLSREARSIFQFRLEPPYGQISQWAEFFLLFMIGIGLPSGSRLMWMFGLLWTGYFWCPYFGGGLTLDADRRFQFFLFGGGWLCTALVLIASFRFFWFRDAWLEKRRGKKRVEQGITTPLPEDRLRQVAKKTAGEAAQAQKALLARTGIRLPRVARAIIAAGVFAGLMVGGGYYLYRSGAFESIQKSAGGILAPPPAVRAAANLQLEGTSVDPAGSYAIINGEVFEVGGYVEGFRITAIDAAGVYLKKDDAEFRLESGEKLKRVNRIQADSALQNTDFP